MRGAIRSFKRQAAEASGLLFLFSLRSCDMEMVPTFLQLLLIVLLLFILVLVFQLVWTLYTDDFSFFERLPGFLGLCRFGQVIDHTFFERISDWKLKMEQTCSSASDLEEESTHSDGAVDPEHGEYKTRLRQSPSLFASGDNCRARRRARRSEV